MRKFIVGTIIHEGCADQVGIISGEGKFSYVELCAGIEVAPVKELEESLPLEKDLLELIYMWKFDWMNQHQNSVEDFKNYRQRAFGIDANMVHDLAKKIHDKLKEGL